MSVEAWGWRAGGRGQVSLVPSLGLGWGPWVQICIPRSSALPVVPCPPACQDFSAKSAGDSREPSWSFGARWEQYQS